MSNVERRNTDLECREIIYSDCGIVSQDMKTNGHPEWKVSCSDGENINYRQRVGAPKSLAFNDRVADALCITELTVKNRFRNLKVNPYSFELDEVDCNCQCSC